MNNWGRKGPGKSSAPASEKPMEEGFPLPESIIVTEILRRLNLESVCTLACVCRSLHFMVSQAIGALSALDLSGFHVNNELLDHIIPRLKEVKAVTVDCLRLDSHNILRILEPCVQELSLLKCVSLSKSYTDLPLIGEKCANVRTLVLELACQSLPDTFRRKLIKMLEKLSYLEDLSINICGTESGTCLLDEIDLFLPKSLKSLSLQSVVQQDAIEFIMNLGCKAEIDGVPTNLTYTGAKLRRLSLVLNIITDALMLMIAESLPLLAELNLEDRPNTEPNMPHDLTNEWIQHLTSCQRLKHLSIVRSRLKYRSSFKRVDDIGLLLLSQGCYGLDSIKLGGFSEATYAGISSLLHACPNLKKCHVIGTPLLSDMAFSESIGCPIVELTLQSCNLRMNHESSPYGHRSAADSCLERISRLTTLTSLNLGGSNISDEGLLALSQANLPLTSLCLKGCVRVTNQGIYHLFKGPKRINKTLSSLNIGDMPGIYDCAILCIVANAEAIAELCVRECPQLTNFAFVALASGRRNSYRNCRLRRLDVAYCRGFSDGMVELLRARRARSFRGLRWLGVFSTWLEGVGGSGSGSDFPARPWLTVCNDGCEMGSCRGWWLSKCF